MVHWGEQWLIGLVTKESYHQHYSSSSTPPGPVLICAEFQSSVTEMSGTHPKRLPTFWQQQLVYELRHSGHRDGGTGPTEKLGRNEFRQAYVFTCAYLHKGHWSNHGCKYVLCPNLHVKSLIPNTLEYDYLEMELLKRYLS